MTGPWNRSQHGFTLIELLVVVAIIALLVSILVPSLQQARRSAKLVVCSSHLHQVGIGAMIYVTQWNGKFPPPCTISVRNIYTEEYGLNEVDNRQNLLDMVSGAAKDIYFCPVYGGARPEDNTVDTQYSDYFLVFPADANRHYVGYNMLFLIRDVGPYVFDWSQSGNTEGLRPLPGDPNSAIVSDTNSWWGYFPDWQRPGYSGHSMTYTKNGGELPGEFRDSNVLYADGHVVTRYAPLEYYVERAGGARYPY